MTLDLKKPEDHAFAVALFDPFRAWWAREVRLYELGTGLIPTAAREINNAIASVDGWGR